MRQQLWNKSRAIVEFARTATRQQLWKKGQAIVEFALAATLIFFLLAAAVDLGLMFFAVQGLHNAAQEGATYGSRWLTIDGAGARVLDFNGIRDRVRHESGSRGGIGFVNLLDLNSNGVPDVSPDTPANLASCSAGSMTTGCDKVSGTPVVNSYIQMWTLEDTNFDGDPLNDGPAPDYKPCTNPNGTIPCFIRVVVSYDYKLSFPLSPTFARQRTLRSSFIMQLRDSFSQGNPAAPTPLFSTLTPTPQTLEMSAIGFYKENGSGKPISIKVFVKFNGVPYNGATVSGTVGGEFVTLAQQGGAGYYSLCNYMGSGGGGFNGNPSASLSATNGSVTVGPQSIPSGASFPCP